MNAGIQFADNMSTQSIQDLLVRSANDLISLENPNYQYAAARLLIVRCVQRCIMVALKKLL